MKFHCLLPILLFSFLSFSQDKEIESFKKILSSKKHDTIKLNALTELNWLYLNSDFLQAKKYADQELVLAKKIKNDKWIAQAYNDLALSFYRMTVYDSAMIYNSKSLKLRKKFKDDLLIASSLSKIAVIKNDLGYYQKSLKIQFEVLGIYEKIDDTAKIGITLNNISLSFVRLKNFKRGIFYGKKAVKIFEKLNDDYSLAQCYGNLGSAYNSLLKNDISLNLHKKALAIFLAVGDMSSAAGIYNGMGMNYRAKKDPIRALENYRKAYEISCEMGELSDKSIYINNICEVLKDLGKYQEAEKLMTENLKNLDTSNVTQQLYTFKQLASIYSNLGIGKKADFYLMKFISLKEKVFNDKEANEIANFEVKYGTEKTKRELAEKNLKLEANKKWMTLSFASVFLVLLVMFFVYRYQKYKRKNLLKQVKLNEELEKSRLEKDFLDEKLRIGRELHDNIGSHLTFMISSLDNLEYVENQQTRIDKIADLSNFGRLTMKDLRDTIWAMNHDEGSFELLITRISELRSVLPNSLFVDIKSGIELTKSLNGLQLLNCYRIVQEFIQNTIKYAEAREIKINLSDNVHSFELSLSDNGNGFDLKEINFGNGILNMKRRCEDLKGEFSVESSEKGTSVICLIPF